MRWTATKGTEACATCGALTTNRSPDGVPRHRSCWNFKKGEPLPEVADKIGFLKRRAESPPCNASWFRVPRRAAEGADVA